VTSLNIAVILGSTRPGRNGKAVADWVIDHARGRAAAYTLIDLADIDLPFLDEQIPALAARYTNPHTVAWAATVAAFDGFVFVTPEYNHTTSPVLLNALDYLYAEWNNKAAAFVSYGSSRGVRAIETLRGVATELQLAHVREQVSFSLYSDFTDFSVLTPQPHQEPQAALMFDQLEAWAEAMRTLRG
jgi:NAD(P)H-dependent FMN reductase